MAYTCLPVPTDGTYDFTRLDQAVELANALNERGRALGGNVASIPTKTHDASSIGCVTAQAQSFVEANVGLFVKSHDGDACRGTGYYHGRDAIEYWDLSALWASAGINPGGWKRVLKDGTIAYGRIQKNDRIIPENVNEVVACLNRLIWTYIGKDYITWVDSTDYSDGGPGLPMPGSTWEQLRAIAEGRWWQEQYTGKGPRLSVDLQFKFNPSAYQYEISYGASRTAAKAQLTTQNRCGVDWYIVPQHMDYESSEFVPFADNLIANKLSYVGTTAAGTGVRKSPLIGSSAIPPWPAPPTIPPENDWYHQMPAIVTHGDSDIGDRTDSGNVHAILRWDLGFTYK